MVNKSPHPRRRAGFTLIEVVISIGIVALVLLPVVALLGTAIDTSREAFTKVNDSRIGAELVGELQQAEWDELFSWNNREIYYDYQGQRIQDGTQEEAVFTARITLKTQGRARGINLGATAVQRNQHLQPVLIAVSSRPGEAGSFAIDRALSGSGGTKNGVHLVRAMIVNAAR